MPSTQPAGPDLHEFQHHWQDEADAAFLYRVLASSEGDPKRRGIYSRLADIGHAPVRFTEDVSTRMPTPEEAEFLRLTPPQPVFFLIRVAFDGKDRPVETCEHIMSGDRWQLSYAWEAD